MLAALPGGVRPIILADRGFARATLLTWLNQLGVDYVIRCKTGTRITRGDGSGFKLTQPDAPIRPGGLRLLTGVRYGLYHDRPRDLTINLALVHRLPRGRRRTPKLPEAPWYLATTLTDAHAAAAWYWQRGWIEQSFKDTKGRFGLDRVQIGCPRRLSRLLTALLIALILLTLLALPETRCLPPGWSAHVSQRGRSSLITTALALLEHLRGLPAGCLPQPLPTTGGYA